MASICSIHSGLDSYMNEELSPPSTFFKTRFPTTKSVFLYYYFIFFQKRLETAVDDAIMKGDYKGAEIISDHMIKSEQFSRMKHAAEARDFVEANAETEEKRKRKQRKKLKWAFGHKERWETKGNM